MHKYLETEHFILIKPRDEDKAFRKLLLTDGETSKFIPRLNEVQLVSVMERQDKQWNDHNFGSCIVCFRDSMEKIGCAGLKYYPPAGPNVADIGCFILPKYQHRGFGTEILKALVGHGFDFHKFEKISAITSRKNIPFIKLAEKLGFKCIKDNMEFEHDGIKFTGYVQYIITRSPNFLPLY